MSNLRKILQHHCNPLHVYCRLRDCGVAEGRAKKISLAYARSLHRLLGF